LQVKRKLYTHNGTTIPYMQLQLRQDGVTVAIMDDDECVYLVFRLKSGFPSA
jgi:hypothetical protein